MNAETVETGTKAPKAKPARPLTPVKVLATAQKACLVQWFDGALERRCSLPVEEVDSDVLPLEVLAQGIPYGLPWKAILKPAVTAEILENALHAAGLWTLADVQMFPDRALSALQSAYGIDLGQLLTAASDYGSVKGG